LGNPRHHIVGTGRWGSWLARRLHASGYEIATVRNRTVSSAKQLAKELGVEWSPTLLHKASHFSEGDLIWCCVPDAEIQKLAPHLKQLDIEINWVHCSGTSPLLDKPSSGVFWPIQSFTSETEPDWSNLPIIVQANNPAFAKTLLEVAEKCSGLSPTQVFSDEDRMRLHLGAVMTQNFSNLLWSMTQNVLSKDGEKETDLDYRILLPLAKNHLDKLKTQLPSQLQTGPASRGDLNTLESHLKLLKGDLPATKVYRLLSELIAKKHN